MPERLTFIVQGSEGDLYEVVADWEDGTLRVSCDCQAGLVGRLCKHRLALLQGDDSGIEEAPAGAAERLAHWAAESAIGAAVAEVLAAEQALGRAKRARQASRKALGRLLQGD